jgi:hypothetical protein
MLLLHYTAKTAVCDTLDKLLVLRIVPCCMCSGDQRAQNYHQGDHSSTNAPCELLISTLHTAVLTTVRVDNAHETISDQYAAQ